LARKGKKRITVGTLRGLLDTYLPREKMKGAIQGEKKRLRGVPLRRKGGEATERRPFSLRCRSFLQKGGERGARGNCRVKGERTLFAKNPALQAKEGGRN